MTLRSWGSWSRLGPNAGRPRSVKGSLMKLVNEMVHSSSYLPKGIYLGMATKPSIWEQTRETFLEKIQRTLSYHSIVSSNPSHIFETRLDNLYVTYIALIKEISYQLASYMQVILYSPSSAYTCSILYFKSDPTWEVWNNWEMEISPFQVWFCQVALWRVGTRLPSCILPVLLE